MNRNVHSLDNFVLGNNIQAKECLGLTSEQECICGGPLEDHLSRETLGKHFEVDSGSLASFSTPSYGTIQFLDYRNISVRKSEFLRFSDDTNAKLIVNLLVEEWDCFGKGERCWLDLEDRTNLFLSVLEDGAILDKKISNNIAQGILQAATASLASVFTSGLQGGVASAVSELFLVFEEPGKNWKRSTGISHWGISTAEKHALTNERFCQLRSSNTSKGRLDGHHDYHLLIDSGLRNHPEKMQKIVDHYRVALDKALLNRGLFGCVILIGGTEGSLDGIRMRLEAGMPIIAISGTGGLADSISERQTQNAQGRAENRIEALLEEFGDMIHIVSALKSNSVPLEILNIFLSGLKLPASSNKHVIHRLPLTWEWFELDEATRTVFNIFQELNENDKFGIVKRALQHEKINLLRYLFKNMDIFTGENFTFQQLIWDFYGYRAVQLKRANFKIVSKQTEFQVHLVKKKPAESNIQEMDNIVENVVIKKVVEDPFGKNIFLFRDNWKHNPDWDHMQVKYPIEELLRWAILAGKYQLAKFLWTQTECPILSALGVGKLLYGQKALVKSQVKQHKLDFQDYASMLLTFMGNKDRLRTKKFLSEARHEAWEKKTVLSLTFDSHSKTFVGTPLIHDYAKEIWNGTQTRNKEFKPPEERIWAKGFSPKLKSYLFYSAYVPFLALLSAYLLFLMDRDNVPVLVQDFLDAFLFTIALAVWLRRVVDVASSLVYKQQIRFFYGKRMTAVSSWWWFGSISFFIYFAGFILRTASRFYTEEDFVEDLLSKSVHFYAVACALFYFQLWEVVIFNKHIGPYVYLIGRMMSYFFSFLFIFMILMLAYSVSSQTLLFPKRQFSYDILLDMFYHPYWQLYGELSLEQTVGGVKTNNCNLTTNYKNEHGRFCAQPDKFAPVLMAIYLLLGSIFLLNLLIAVFSFVFESSQVEFNDIWKYQKTLAILLWDQKTAFPPPFSLVPDCISLAIVLKTVCSTIFKNDQVCPSSETGFDEDLRSFERQCFRKFLYKLEHGDTDDLVIKRKQKRILV